MPHLSKTGPENEGEKTGRKLGICSKSESDKGSMGELGKGQRKRRHSSGGDGQGKRLQYNKSVN